MKKLLILLSVFISVFTISSCEEEKPDTSFCNNLVKDGNESEVDCGGNCEACPDAAYLNCTLGTSDYTSVNPPTGQILGPSIRVNAVDAEGRPLNFMFIVSGLNQPIQISAATFSYHGNPYVKGELDTGTVVITAQDTLRKIISGTFGFRCNRIGAGQVAAASGGVFTNVRYK